MHSYCNLQWCPYALDYHPPPLDDELVYVMLRTCFSIDKLSCRYSYIPLIWLFLILITCFSFSICFLLLYSLMENITALLERMPTYQSCSILLSFRAAWSASRCCNSFLMTSNRSSWSLSTTQLGNVTTMKCALLLDFTFSKCPLLSFLFLHHSPSFFHLL